MTLSLQYFGVTDSSYYAILCGILFVVIMFLHNVSNIFLRHPLLLHTSKEGIIQRNKIQCIGHRGSKNDGLPENTIAAFKDSCLRSGSDTIELDVWLTKDGEVIVHHNETISQSSSSSSESESESESSEAHMKVYKITETCYKDLPCLINSTNENNYERIKSYSSLSIHTTTTSTNNHTTNTTTTESTTTNDNQNKNSIPSLSSLSSSLTDEWQKVPTLQQVFEHIPNHIFIIVEFKQNSDELIQKVHQLIQSYKRQETTIWFSLSEIINSKLRRYDEKITNMTSIHSMLKILLLYYIGVLPFVSIHEHIYGLPFLEVTYESARSEGSFAALPDFVIKLLVYLFQGRPPGLFLCTALYTHLRARGMSVFVLGVDTPADVSKAQQIGATAVLTDKPSWLVPYMKENKIKFARVALRDEL